MAFTLNDLKYDGSKSAEENLKNAYKFLNNMVTVLNYTLNNLDASDIVISNGESLNELYETGALRGSDGRNGRDGSDGVGVPSGGTTGQVLRKLSDDDFDTGWVDVEDL